MDKTVAAAAIVCFEIRTYGATAKRLARLDRYLADIAARSIPPAGLRGLARVVRRTLDAT